MKIKKIVSNYQEVSIAGENFILLPEKAIYWPEKRILILSDLHLGKINHFRRAGIAVPSTANQRNVELMISILQQWKPDRVIFLGDLFHSHYNPEWEVFGQVLNYFPAVSFELVMGNHDIMSKHQYLKHKLLIHDPLLVVEPFIFSHEEPEEVPAHLYLLSGHVHPGVVIKGKGRQKLKLPCFYFSEKNGILPAFGEFTGTSPIAIKDKDKVYVILENKVMEKI